MTVDPHAGGRIADIEVLRAVAVLFVILHHANGVLFVGGVPGAGEVYAWFGGWVGVDLFFAISGFVIARVLMQDLASVNGTRDFLTRAGGFWIRRAFRLFPLAWTWLAIVLLLAAGFNESGVFGSVRTNVDATVAGVLQFANWRFAQAFGQFEYGASFVYWSLSLEEQFYLVLPLAMLLPRRALLPLLALLALVQASGPRGLVGMSFRTDALCLGVLVAMLSHTPAWSRWRAWIGRAPGIACLAVVLLLALMAVLGSPTLRTLPVHVGLIALCGAAVVLLAGPDAGIIAARLPAALRSALLWAGARSYALYLVHVPVYLFARELAHRAGEEPATRPVLSALLAALLIVLLAETGYRAIEAPMRARGRRLAVAWLARRGAPHSNLVETSR